MSKYTGNEPTIIKFSESGAKFMQLNMVAHDYGHDFNPGAQIGKERIKKAFSHVLQITEFLNKLQHGGVSMKTKTGIFKSKGMLQKFNRKNMLNSKTFKMPVKSNNIKLPVKSKTEKLIMSKILLNNKNIYSGSSQLNEFNNKINSLTLMDEESFVNFFYNNTLEDAIYVYVFQLLGFINYLTNHVKNGDYVKYIYNSFQAYNTFINNKRRMYMKLNNIYLLIII